MKMNQDASVFSMNDLRGAEQRALSSRHRYFRPTRWLGIPGLCTLLASCGISLEYSTSGLARLDAGSVVAADVDILDGRYDRTDKPKPILEGRSAKKDFRQLRAAVHDHFVATGVVKPDVAPLAAPTSPEELESVLSRAAEQGPEILLFPCLTAASGHHREHYMRRSINGLFYAMTPFGGVGLMPILVYESLQIHDEMADACVRLLVIDSRRRELLGSFEGHGSYKGKSSYWRLNGQRRVPDVIRDAVQAALSAYESAAKAGFPDRMPLGDHLANVVSGRDRPGAMPPAVQPASPIASGQ